MEKVKMLDEKKFMWDGRTYMGEAEANTVKAEYEKNNFETFMVSDEDKYFLFTRKIVTEIEIEQQ
jgi:hypothetical protein